MSDRFERWLIPDTVVQAMIPTIPDTIFGCLELPQLMLTFNNFCLNFRVGKSSIQGVRLGLFLSIRKELDWEEVAEALTLEPGELLDIGVCARLLRSCR